VANVETRHEWDLLSSRPEQRAAWEELPDGRVVLLRPKFIHPLLVRWVLPRLKRKNFRIALDEAGSFLWKASDGQTTVEVIGRRMQAELGLDADTVFPRIASFLRQLERDQFIRVHRQPD